MSKRVQYIYVLIIVIRAFFTSIFILITWATVFAQDGSDMRYITLNRLNSSFIGKFAHLDFYRNSFMFSFATFSGKIRAIDTVFINIDNTPVKFIEHRVDDGFNNWFFEQYLASLYPVAGEIIRISKCKIDSITTDSIQVTNYLDFYDLNNNLLTHKSRQQMCWFKKEIITEVLIKSE